MTSALVIIPTYNERENIAMLVPQVLAHEGYRVLVVDDRSPDGTGDVVDGLARQFPGRVQVLRRRGPRGLGRSYIEALLRARSEADDFVCQMDADLSHDPKYLPVMTAAIVDRGCDLVIGSRYTAGGGIRNWPFTRLVLSRFANLYVRMITRLPAADCTSGFRTWRREALARLPLEQIASEGYAFLVEMLYVAHRVGCRVGEVPIVFVERRVGQSKLSMGIVLESVVTPWRLILGRRG
jgi:dolichol-phosphate mannosyltransferase